MNLERDLDPNIWVCNCEKKTMHFANRIFSTADGDNICSSYGVTMYFINNFG